jgi:hypothetical protein
MQRRLIIAMEPAECSLDEQRPPAISQSSSTLHPSKLTNETNKTRSNFLEMLFTVQFTLIASTASAYYPTCSRRGMLDFGDAAAVRKSVAKRVRNVKVMRQLRKPVHGPVPPIQKRNESQLGACDC